MERQWEVNTYENEKGKFNLYPGLCKGCGLCIEKCPVKVIEWSKQLGFLGTPAVLPRMDGCIVCGTCQTVCPDAAIHIERFARKAPPMAAPVRETADPATHNKK
ncbi:4Fe-4S ferredoxin [Thermincola ferriacetica]|uniref:4Fe-4S ferredoxin n=1 Tax=Thermincola ferriacetica TaxID=281456 RepID=A0A0L6VYI0_9FIRM|nr:ferredoxin family protein [Thermincola ferriacetica]KNZ68266.1 4Fe-4S ferredoxin [Thermincola ferriacetica]